MTSHRGSTHVLKEITPLKQEDCLYVIARKKDCFDFPLHTHREYELNFIEGAKGAERIVGDSIETLSDKELVLVANENLEHGWVNANLESNQNIFEITIQFSPELLPEEMLGKNQFLSIRTLLEKARMGIAFSFSTIMRVKHLLNSLTCESTGFYMVTTFMNILYELSNDEDMHTLASQSFVQDSQSGSSHRVRLISGYIEKNLHRNIRLSELAELVHMSEGALSRYFKSSTGQSITDYIVGMRIGKAARDLVNTDKTIAEISFSCGFNNNTNFNRLFKKRKGCTPKEFRGFYRKTQVLV